MNSAEKQTVLHCLKSMIDEEVCEECPLYGMTGTDHCEKDCVRLAINALEHEPCEDTISRQAAIDACLNGWNKDYKEIVKEIRALPPVTPQYTEAEIQKMQDLEFAEIQKAYEIGKAENPNKWIPVSERLPEWHWEAYGDEKVWDGERVLACVKEADEYYDLVGVAKYGPHGWESEDEGFCSCLASKPVIAWMPLPEPYKASPTGAESEEV
jgi:hypothetical protein